MWARVLAPFGQREWSKVRDRAECYGGRSETSARSGLDVRLGRTDSIPLPDASASVVACNSVLLLVPEDLMSKSLRETARICRPNARVWLGEIPRVEEKRAFLSTKVSRKCCGGCSVIAASGASLECADDSYQASSEAHFS